jgi:hypothetical protein
MPRSIFTRRCCSRFLGAAGIALGLCLGGSATASAQSPTTPGFDQSAPVGVTLEADRVAIKSALRVDLTFEYATLPLHRGTAGGQTVWYVRRSQATSGYWDALRSSSKAPRTSAPRGPSLQVPAARRFLPRPPLPVPWGVPTTAPT